MRSCLGFSEPFSSCLTYELFLEAAWVGAHRGSLASAKWDAGKRVRNPRKVRVWSHHSAPSQGIWPRSAIPYSLGAQSWPRGHITAHSYVAIPEVTCHGSCLSRFLASPLLSVFLNSSGCRLWALKAVSELWCLPILRDFPLFTHWSLAQSMGLELSLSNGRGLP